MKKLLFPCVLLLALSVAAFQISCSKAESASTEVLDVQPGDAADTLANESIVVLDVRTPEEVAMGHIPGSININIADPEFAAQIAKLDSSKTYMVHCQAGSPGGRSRRSVEALETLGVKRIYHLEGGFMGWQSAGNEVEVSQK